MSKQLSFLPTNSSIRETALSYIPAVRDLPPAERPINRLHQAGVGALSTTELLSIILGTSHALTDASKILAAFNNLFELTRASLPEIEAQDGVGKATAARIKAALELGRRAMLVSPDICTTIRSPTDCAQLLMSEMAHLEQEHLRTILLNTRNGVIAVITVYIGTLNSSHIRTAEVFREAIRHNAASMIVVHNHPSGDPTPSPEDVEVTRLLIAAGHTINIEIMDHLIIGQQRFVSLREHGLGFD